MSTPDPTLAGIGEAGLIHLLNEYLHGKGQGDAGDDAAVVPLEGTGLDLILCSDPVIEGVHFVSEADPFAVGHKAAGRVLSDIAAMGGDPRWLLVNLALPAATRVDWVEAVYRGMHALAKAHGVQIVGGDCSRAETRHVHVFGAGTVPAGDAVLRSGTIPGDLIFVTGALGGSLLGHHLNFDPRVREGRWLREGRWATSMTDVTDGLAPDARWMALAGRVGMELESARIPVRYPGDPNAWKAALDDGEDFELLFTVPHARAGAFSNAWKNSFSTPCTQIGTVTAEAGQVWLVEPAGRRMLSDEGFDHFQNRV